MASRPVRALVVFVLGASMAFLSGHQIVPTPNSTDKRPSTDTTTIRRLMTPNDAVVLALADNRLMPDYAARTVRYLWLGPEGAVEDAKTASLVLNMVSRSSTLKRPDVLQRGNLVRVRLEDFAPTEKDLKEWLKIWEDFQFDPLFNLLLTRDTLKFAQQFIASEIGDHYKAEKDVDVVRINGPHIDPKALQELQGRSHSAAPVVSLWYFAQRALTTIKDVDKAAKKSLYATLYGGRYYELAGIKKIGDVYDDYGKATDLDLFLARRGVGSIEERITYRDLFDRLRSDKRFVMELSGVTGKPRLVEWFHGPDTGDGTGTISVTNDLRDQDIDIGTDPFMNLLNQKALAFEVIAEKGNGLHLYAIFNDKQELLDEGAINVVGDSTVPSPHTPRLQSGVSCIACHETEGSDGWKALHSDVTDILSGKTRLDVVTDLSEIKRPLSDVIDRLKGLYPKANPVLTKHIFRARNDYAEAILRAGGPWPQSSTGQTDVVRVATGYLIKGIRRRQYDLVDTKTALSDLGFEAPARREVETMVRLLPPEPQPGPFVVEDVRAAQLKEGKSLQRHRWDLFYGFAASRAQKASKNLEPKAELPLRGQPQGEKKQ
jgi:hypothetical protein